MQEHVVVLLIFGGIAFFKLLNYLSKNTSENFPVQRKPLPPQRSEIPMDERMREALGLPSDFITPPKISKPPELPLNLPPLKKGFIKPVTVVTVVKTPPKEYLITRHPSDHTDKHIGLHKALSSRSNLRQAIVLKEILDLPKGLQPDFSGYIR